MSADNISPTSPAGTVAMGDLLAEANWIRALARSLVKDASTADDVVQETWLAILRKPPRIGQPLRPWLAKVVRNFARMRRRGEFNRRRREELSARSEAVPATTHMVEKVELQRVLAHAVLQLEEPFRSTVLLRYFEGLSAAEIARRTDTPAGTVRWRLKRGLDDLRQSLDQERGGRAGWFSLVLAIAEGPGGPLGIGTALGVPVPLALALFFGLVTLVAAVFGPRLLDRGERGGIQAVGPVVETDLDRGASSESALTQKADGARQAAESSSQGLREFLGGVKGPGRRVEARVVDSSGAPVEGAELAVPGASAFADAEGQVALALGSAPSAPLEVVIRGEGYVSHREQVRVLETRTAHLGRVVLEAAGSVRGRVSDQSGAPLAGAVVTFEALSGRWQGHRHRPLENLRYPGSLLDRKQDPTPRTRTGADGVFRVTGLPPGYVRIWAGGEGFFYDFTRPVAVQAELESRAPELILRAPAEVELLAGQVTGPGGAPVPGAEIEAARRSLKAAFFRGESTVFQTTADEYGRFELALETHTRYAVAARDPGGRWRPTVSTPHHTGERDVLIRLAEWRTFELELDGLGAGDAVQLELADARNGKRLVPETLAAELPRVRAPALSFLVRVRARGFAPLELGPFEPDRVPPVLHADLFAFDGARGRVFFDDGSPAAGASVLLLAALGEDRARSFPARSSVERPLFTTLAKGKARGRTTTDGEGRFVLPEALGSFFLRVEAEHRAPALIGPFELDGTPVEPFAITLDRGGSIAGRVVAADGGDTAGVIVGVTAGDGRVRSQRVTPEGEYRFDDLTPGLWQVRRLSRETPQPGWFRLTSRDELVARETVSFDCEVSAGSVTPHDLLLEPELRCTLAGRLLIDGLPPGPWHAQLVALDPARGEERRAAAVDHEGRFELSVIGAGHYALELWNSGYRPLYVLVRDELELRPGAQPWRFDFISSSLSGEGAEPDDELVHAWQGGGYLTVTTFLASDEDGRFQAERVPAGTARLELGGRPDTDLSLPAGSNTHVTLGD